MKESQAQRADELARKVVNVIREERGISEGEVMVALGLAVWHAISSMHVDADKAVDLFHKVLTKIKNNEQNESE